MNEKFYGSWEERDVNFSFVLLINDNWEKLYILKMEGFLLEIFRERIWFVFLVILNLVLIWDIVKFEIEFSGLEGNFVFVLVLKYIYIFRERMF